MNDPNTDKNPSDSSTADGERTAGDAVSIKRRVPYLFSMQIDAWDERELLRAARASYLKDHEGGLTRADGFLSQDGVVDVAACLIQLLDPAVPGCSVLHSSARALTLTERRTPKT